MLKNKRKSSVPATILFYNFTSAVSGAEVVLLDLIKGIIATNLEHSHQNYQLVLVCPNGGPLWERASAIKGLKLENIRTLKVGYTRNPLILLGYLFQLLRVSFDLAKIVILYKPVLLHANAVRAGLVGCIVAFVMRTPVIVHLHDKLGISVIDRLIRILFSLLATKLISISDYTRKAFTQNKPSLEQKTVTIYNGVDINQFDPRLFVAENPQAVLLKEWPQKPAGYPNEMWPLLGIVGQITPWKGHLTALEALNQLVNVRKTAPNARLIIVGGLKFAFSTARYNNAEFYQELLGYIEDKKLQEHVWFCGERENIPELMYALDFLLLPSWYEPFGRVVIEAMAMERVVIASAEGGPLEIIENGENGVLVQVKEVAPLVQAIENLCENPEKVKRIGLKARDRVVEYFSTTLMVNAFLAVYNEVTKGRSNVRD